MTSVNETRNLYTNPSFKNGLANTAALNGASLAINPDYSWYGNDSLEVTKSADNNSGVRSTIPISVVAGKPYAVSAYLRLPVELPRAESANIMLSVDWQNSINTSLQIDSSGILTLDQDDTWARIGGVWQAPVGATRAYVSITQVIGGTAGATFLVDAILFQQSNYIGGYQEDRTQAEENALVNRALTPAVPSVINGLELNADITLNDLVLNTIDEDGTVWICTSIIGWWGQSTPDLPDIQRGTEDGSYDVSGRYQSRILTINGSFYPANTDEALSAATDRLVTATDLVRKGGWLRTNEGPTKAAWVRLSGRPSIETVNARGRTDFSIGLRAPDPIKYHWNDADSDGYTVVHIEAADESGIAENIGTAVVTGEFTVTGPTGAGTRIYNALTDETLTIVPALRGAGVVGTVISASVTDNVATLETSANHHLILGDEIIVAGMGSPYDSVNETQTVIGTSQEYPYTVSFALSSDDVDEFATSGQIQLAYNDTLIIDTYNRAVSYNGSEVGQRAKLETLTDWITLAPGENIIEFADDIDTVKITRKQIIGNVAKLTTDDVHYFVPGEDILVELPDTAELSKKSLTSNVVTMTTQEPHGFSVGDIINVASREISTVNEKSASTTVATLTTVDTNGVSVSDVIVVALPVSASPVTKALTSNVATITTQNAHGYSPGDSVTVTMPTSANVTFKALSGNQATLTTSAPHGFQVGDSITVAISEGVNVINKARSGSQAVITTDVTHGFSTGDSVVMSFPENATLTDTRSIAGSAGGYLVTLNTTLAHNFSVGDRLTVNIGVTSTLAVTNRQASGTTCTLTVGTHPWNVGEKVTVSGIGARYDGTFYITSKTSTTITYAFVGASEVSTASSGSVLNETIANYYNGSNKIIESIPSSTSLTYLAYNQDVATSSTAAGTGATLTNTSNITFNGTKTLTSASGTTFSYIL